MRTSELARRLRNRIRKASGIETGITSRRSARKLVLETMEHRYLLAADLFMDNSIGESCQEWEITDVELTDNPVVFDFTKVEDVDGSDLSPPVTMQSALPTPQVVGAYVYHHNSVLASLGMESALDSTKQLAREGYQPTKLNFQNLIGSSRGINGLVIDVIHLPSETLTVEDLYFQVSPVGAFNELNHPAVGWESAPEPEQISVSKDQESDISRVSIQWADSAITNRWLRVTILANSSTGLPNPEVYYIGHLQGKSTDWTINFNEWNPSGVYEVHSVDRIAIRQQIGQTVDAGSVYDMNKDGYISFADIAEMRSAIGMQLSNITVSSIAAVPVTHVAIEEPAGQNGFSFAELDLMDETREATTGQANVEDEGSTVLTVAPPVHSEMATEIIGAYVYHRNSQLAAAGMESALDSSTRLAIEAGEPKTLGVQNLTNSSRGINGLVFDLSNLRTTNLTVDDFQFQVSPVGAFNELQNPATEWDAAPTPELISVKREGPLRVVRVSIHWEDHAIMNRWLRITVRANSNTGLATDEVYYIGHLQGKSTDWLINYSGLNPSGIYEVHQVDSLAIRQRAGQLVDAGNPYDVNKDGIISFRDISEMRNSLGTQLSNITIAKPVALVVSDIVPESSDVLIDASIGSEIVGGFDSHEAVTEEATSSPNAPDLLGDVLPELPQEVLDSESQATIVGSFVYYHNSVLAMSGMEHALDTTKQLAKETDQATKLNVHNLINSSRGINGLVFDLMNMSAESLTEADFRFQVSPTGAFNELENPAVLWELGPAPELISVSNDKQTGISRASILWADAAIMNRWLRVTVLATSNTGLPSEEVYYIGHLQGKSTDWLINYGGWNPSGVYEVHWVDTLAIREQVGQIDDAGNIYDVNKDGMVTFRDIAEMRASVGTQLSNITIAGLAATGPAPSSSDSEIDEEFALDSSAVTLFDGSTEIAIMALVVPPIEIENAKTTVADTLSRSESVQPEILNVIDLQRVKHDSSEATEQLFALDEIGLDFELFEAEVSDLAEDVHKALGESFV